MPLKVKALCVCLLLHAVDAAALSAEEPPVPGPQRQALTKAVAFLAREVPAWHAQNGCYSCHNNGDAARALFHASRTFPFASDALTGTIDWLKRPEKWTDYGDKAEFSDDRLATLQFTLALGAAGETGHVESPRTLKQAARLLAGYQREDGSFSAQDNALIGSPATYGPYLATYLASRVLRRADADAFGKHAANAERWLRESTPKSVFDSAAVLLAVADAAEEADQQRNSCLERVLAGQAPDGGWGPYANARSEAFDTAIALQALLRLPPHPTRQQAIERGVAYLVRAQLSDGSWQATTRPPDSGSYAQKISTTAWATLALLESQE